MKYIPWITRQGTTAIDEKCRCGALRTAHADTYSPGHGGCAATGCAKFTWVGFIYAPKKDAA